MDDSGDSRTLMKKLFGQFFSDTDRCRSLIDSQGGTVSGNSVYQVLLEGYGFKRGEVDLHIFGSSVEDEAFRQWVTCLRDEGYSNSELVDGSDSVFGQVLKTFFILRL